MKCRASVPRPKEAVIKMVKSTKERHGDDWKSGVKHHNWKGGRLLSSKGYWKIWKPQHPLADVSGYVFEHRLIMEKFLGRILSRSEFVHHKNTNKKDNVIENLQVVTIKEHAKIHNLIRNGNLQYSY